MSDRTAFYLRGAGMDLRPMIRSEREAFQGLEGQGWVWYASNGIVVVYDDATGRLEFIDPEESRSESTAVQLGHRLGEPPGPGRWWAWAAAATRAAVVGLALWTIINAFVAVWEAHHG